MLTPVQRILRRIAADGRPLALDDPDDDNVIDPRDDISTPILKLLRGRIGDDDLARVQESWASRPMAPCDNPTPRRPTTAPTPRRGTPGRRCIVNRHPPHCQSKRSKHRITARAPSPRCTSLRSLKLGPRGSQRGFRSLRQYGTPGEAGVGAAPIIGAATAVTGASGLGCGDRGAKRAAAKH
jgi:hypothetical protein